MNVDPISEEIETIQFHSGLCDAKTAETMKGE